MADITKLDLYLNERQYHKLCLVADSQGKTPEQVANEAVYSYLSIVDPSAVDYDDMSPEQQAEADRQYEEWCRSEDLFDPLDPCVELDGDGHRI